MCPRAHLYTVCGLRCLSLHVEAHTNEHTHTTSSTLLMEVLRTGDIFECFIKGLQNGTVESNVYLLGVSQGNRNFSI